MNQPRLPCGYHTCADATFAEAMHRIYQTWSDATERAAAIQATRELWVIVRGFRQ